MVVRPRGAPLQVGSRQERADGCWKRPGAALVQKYWPLGGVGRGVGLGIPRPSVTVTVLPDALKRPQQDPVLRQREKQTVDEEHDVF